MKKPFFREYALEFGLIVFLLALILFTVSTLAVWGSGWIPKFLKSSFDAFFSSGWAYWGVFIGALVALIGGWVFIDTALKLREFRKLISETSRAKFIKNQDRLEYLAWKLSSKQGDEFLDRKKELRIKV